MRKSTNSITLTLIAAVSVMAVAGCDDEKSRARKENACRVDPNSEDCLSNGRSHSSFSYMFFGHQPYGQPSYYHNPAYAYNPALNTRSSYYSGAPAARVGGFSSGESSAIGGGVARGGFGASASAHAGGGE